MVPEEGLNTPRSHVIVTAISDRLQTSLQPDSNAPSPPSVQHGVCFSTMSSLETPETQGFHADAGSVSSHHRHFFSSRSETLKAQSNTVSVVDDSFGCCSFLTSCSLCVAGICINSAGRDASYCC